MKKYLCLLLALLLILAPAGCSSRSPESAELDGEVDALASPSVNDPGNVQQLAGWIQAETGGDLFSIQVADPYPSDWDACLELEAVYALNDSPAADTLWAQLPLTPDGTRACSGENTRPRGFSSSRSTCWYLSICLG